MDRAEDAAPSSLAIRTVRDRRDTLDLRYGLVTNGAPRQFVVFLNGRTEWVEKYDYLATDLELPEGTGFLTMDHRGQGASGGARAYVDDYDTYAEDVRTVLETAVGGLPYVVLSHSMGALITLHAALKGYIAPKAMVLGSPLLGLPDQPVPRVLAQPLARLLSKCMLGSVSTGAGTFTAIPFENNHLTQNADRYRRMQNGPYKVPGATFGWVAATFKAIGHCFTPAALTNLTAPTLVLGASKESVVDPESLRVWVRAATAHAPADVQLRIINGAKHELFSELPEPYAQAIAAVNTWFRPHLK